MSTLIVEMDEETFYDIDSTIKRADNYAKILMVITDAITRGASLKLVDYQVMIDGLPLDALMLEWADAGLFDLLSPKYEKEETPHE